MSYILWQSVLCSKKSSTYNFLPNSQYWFGIDEHCWPLKRWNYLALFTLSFTLLPNKWLLESPLELFHSSGNLISISNFKIHGLTLLNWNNGVWWFAQAPLSLQQHRLHCRCAINIKRYVPLPQKYSNILLPWSFEEENSKILWSLRAEDFVSVLYLMEFPFIFNNEPLICNWCISCCIICQSSSLSAMPAIFV